MNKTKFEEKCKALYAHEDEMLQKMTEYIKPFNEELCKQGAEIVCRLFWFCQNENDVLYEESRKLIMAPRQFYRCVMSLQFQKIGAKEDADSELGFQLFDDVTAYGVSIFTGWSFRKFRMKFAFNNVYSHYIMVRDMGLETATKLFFQKHKRCIEKFDRP